MLLSRDSTAGPAGLRPGRTLEQGVVLPIAMIMLVLFSFVGLLAARNSANYEQFSNNLRTNQVARQAAELALRHCENVVIDLMDNEGKIFTSDSANVLKEANKAASIDAGNWNTMTNWVGANAIQVAPTYSENVQSGSKVDTQPKPRCIAQQLGDDGRFLITARGLSLDAAVNSTSGKLTQGSEVWLQSIIAPGVPVVSTAGGSK